MSEAVEYETPVNCFRRLTQNDKSEKFDIIINISKDGERSFVFGTTQNKARIISKKIDEIFQIDPTITKYKLNVPNLIIKSNQNEEAERKINRSIEYLFKSTIEKVTISKEELEIIEVIKRLLGGYKDDNKMIKFDSIEESISYISTEFHDDSIRYLSIHLNEIIEGGQIFNLNEEIIDEIIDCYFNESRCREGLENGQKQEEVEEIFEKLSQKGSVSNVMHFLLACESDKYTKEMREYIIENLSDEIIYKEQSQIIRQFIQLLIDKSDSNREGVELIEYEGDELKGIISHLEDKFGENILSKGELKISDIGTHKHSDGSLSNIIKYDENHINEYYKNNNGDASDPVPDSSNGWIEIDFLKRKINITSYTLRSSQNGTNSCYHAKSWRIVGSNDRENWEVVDQQVNNSSLNGKYKQCRFECSRSDKYYRYIRYIQDDSWYLQREHNIYLTCVEFFGSILSE